MASTLATTYVTAYKVPLSAVALWPTPNFQNGVRRYWLIPFSICLEVFSTSVVITRLWARRARTGGKLGVDDILIVMAWMCATLLMIEQICGVSFGGYDRHVWDIYPAMARRSGFIAWISEMTFLWASFLTKLSVLIFYRRFVNTTYSRRLTHAITFAILCTVAYVLGFQIFLLAVCKPISANWTSIDITNVSPYKCIDRKAADISIGVTSVITDIFALIIPQIVISSLQVQTKRKLTLSAVFSSGLLIIGAGMARTYYFFRLHTDPRRDLSWIGHDIFTWGILEAQAGIVCASAPALWAVIKKKRSRSMTQYGTPRSKTFESIGTPVTPKDIETCKSQMEIETTVTAVKIGEIRRHTEIEIH